MKIFIANGLFFFSLLPFVSPLPIGSDTQPIAFLFSSAFLFLLFLERNLSLNFLEVLFLVMAFFSIFYFGFDNSYSFEARHRLGLLMGGVTFIAAAKAINLFSMKVLILASIINFIGVIWHYSATDSFVFFAEYFVREIKITEFTGRGASGFAPENSFTAVVAIFHVLIGYFFYFHKKTLSKSGFRLIFLLSSVTIFLTSSGSGYMFALFLMLIFLITKLNLRRFLTYTFGSIFLYLAIINSPLQDSRGVSLIKILISEPSLLLLDGSIAERALAVEIGIQGLIMYPFGKGAGAYEEVAKEVEREHVISTKYPTARSERLLKETISSFARYLSEIGIIYLVFVIVLFLKSIPRESYSIMAVSMAFLMLIVSFSIIFPPTYILLATSHLDNQ